MPRNLNRSARFETFESRLVMSAQALNDIVADFQLDSPHIDIDQQIEVIAQSLHEGAYNNDAQTIHEQYDLDGSGQTIAVIDSGIAFDHIAFGEGFGTGHRVVGGYDFAENDANPYDDGPIGLHGTHVAGIIGAASDQFSGVAPGADLVSLRVFDDFGNGQLEWVEQALQWVHDNRHAFESPITTVNLSLGTDWNADFVPDAAQLENEFAQLEADGIFVSVAAGNLFNEFNEPGVSYPAASPFVVPVASHGADGSLSDFSQRNDRVLVAPGDEILSTVPDHLFGGGLTNQYLRSSGTSQAAPYVAGASALLREAFELTGVTGIDQDLLYSQFRNTADLIFDQVTGGYFHRINLQRAIETVLQELPFDSDANQTEPVYTDNGVLFIHGTGGNDDIQFHSGAILDIYVNGENYQLDRAGISEIVVVGGSGTDSIAASFAGTIDLAVMQVSRLDVHGPAVDFTARGFEFIDLDGGLNADRLVMWDSGGNDIVTADYESVSSVGPGYANTASGFTRISVRATDGFDLLHLTGTDGNDRFTADDGRNVLNAAGRIVSTGFDSTLIIAGAGNDYAHLYDSAGNDQFELAGRSFQVDTQNYRIWGGGFERIIANADSGFDVVNLTGTALDDNLIHRSDKTRMQSNLYLNTASGFDRVSAWASGGADVARIYDTTGDDSFHAEGFQGRLESANQILYTQGFESIDVHAGGGFDTAYIAGTAGDDFVSATGSSVRFEGPFASELTIRNHDHVVVDTLGGYDSTDLLGGEGIDLLRSIENGLEFESTVQLLRIVGAENHDFQGGGGLDQVLLNDFDRLDLLQALGDQAVAYLKEQQITVRDFDFLEARTRSGETGFYEIDAVDFLYLLDGEWLENESH